MEFIIKPIKDYGETKDSEKVLVYENGKYHQAIMFYPKGLDADFTQLYEEIGFQGEPFLTLGDGDRDNFFADFHCSTSNKDYLYVAYISLGRRTEQIFFTDAGEFISYLSQTAAMFANVKRGARWRLLS